MRTCLFVVTKRSLVYLFSYEHDETVMAEPSLGVVIPRMRTRSVCAPTTPPRRSVKRRASSTRRRLASGNVARAEQELEEAVVAQQRAESAVIEAQLACDRQEKRPEPRGPATFMLDALSEEWDAEMDAYSQRLRAYNAAQREAAGLVNPSSIGIGKRRTS
mmetsp:Transcript_51761/g.143337  ORF Transcript_51761/g.143337 Transcript_51761/m.143337 type:complete len:161 (-) Transcript_51761:180-662(-)